MNKNINNVVELTEKELACISGGSSSEEFEGTDSSKYFKQLFDMKNYGECDFIP